MKRILRDIVLNSLVLYILTSFIKGISIINNLEAYLLGGLFLTLGDYIIKPILTIITLPFTLITFGLFSSVVYALTLYVVTIIYPKIQILAFQFDGISFFGFVIPAFFVPLFLSYYLISVIIYIIKKLIFWLFQ